MASEGNLLVFVPRDTRNTILPDPDLTINLPDSGQGSIEEVGLSRCVNNIRVGEFGDLEIIALVLSDGDFIAYYTHVINHRVELAAKEGTSASHIRDIRP